MNSKFVFSRLFAHKDILSHQNRRENSFCSLHLSNLSSILNQSSFDAAELNLELLHIIFSLSSSEQLNTAGLIDIRVTTDELVMTDIFPSVAKICSGLIKRIAMEHFAM